MPLKAQVLAAFPGGKCRRAGSYGVKDFGIPGVICGLLHI